MNFGPTRKAKTLKLLKENIEEYLYKLGKAKIEEGSHRWGKRICNTYLIFCIQNRKNSYNKGIKRQLNKQKEKTERCRRLEQTLQEKRYTNVQ